MSRPHIRGPGYTGSMGAPGYEVPYASNYDYDNQFFTNRANDVFTGVSLPGFLVPPVGIYEGFQDARHGKLQLPGGLGSLTPPVSSDREAAKDKSDWSGVAKVAIVAGTALALYFIFRSSEGARPVAKKLGGFADKIISARTGAASSHMMTPKHMALLARTVEST
jgi:hypothetical protein